VLAKRQGRRRGREEGEQQLGKKKKKKKKTKRGADDACGEEEKCCRTELCVPVVPERWFEREGDGGRSDQPNERR
jgi:hypothetical protein